MLFRLLVVPIVLPAFGLAQTADLIANRQILEELKGIRTSLEKLEKGQNALVALARTQIDEGRLAVLEAQRLDLLAQERQLERDIAAGSGAPHPESTAALPTLVRSNPGGPPEFVQATGASPAADHAAASSRKLAEVRRGRQAVEQSIDTLRKRIAVWEKRIEEALR